MTGLSGVQPMYNSGYDVMLHTLRNNPEDARQKFHKILQDAVEKQGKGSTPGAYGTDTSKGIFPGQEKKAQGGVTVSGPLDRLSSAKLLDACYEMEAIFIGTMLKQMQKTVYETDFFGKSIAKDIFRDMLYDEYAKLMAKSDQIGLARQIYKQLRG